jgi:hypothetical protein
MSDWGVIGSLKHCACMSAFVLPPLPPPPGFKFERIGPPQRASLLADIPFLYRLAVHACLHPPPPPNTQASSLSASGPLSLQRWPPLLLSE